MATTAAVDPTVPPMPFVVAAWLGFPREHIVRGLQRGTIAPPADAPPGWLPSGAAPDAASDTPDGGASPADPAVAAGDAALSTGGADTPPADPEPDASPADPEPDTAGAPDPRAAHLELVRAIDASLDDATFDALWRSSGGDDATRSAAVRALLWRTIGVVPPQDDGIDALAAAIPPRGTRGTLVSLASEGSAAVAERARRDPAMLDALVAMHDFAFTDVVQGASAGAVRFDPMSGDAHLSDAWIDDRAKFVAWRGALAADPDAATAVPVAWRFLDRAQGDGSAITLGAAVGDPNQVVFAQDDGDAVTGGSAVDRLHGGSGGDTLDGEAGDDLVEGAAGDDVLSGGRGDDLLDGGAGDDRLAGGWGDDRLHGGSGHDSYRFARGDGDDVIDDADGAGAIVLDGVVLDGSEEDVGYSVERDGSGATMLVVATGGTSAGRDEIRVRNWHEGDLGIHLAPPASAGEAGRPANGHVAAPEQDAGEPGAGLLPALKPRVTFEPETSPCVREAGNESGTGWPQGETAPQEVAPVCDSGSRAGVGPVQAVDVARVLEGRPAFASAGAVAVPPAFDPDAVTAADVAGALADVADDQDDGDALSPPIRLPWWMAHDAQRGVEPPDALPRRGS